MCKINSRFEILCLETAQEQKDRRIRQKEERKKSLKRIEDYGVCEGFQGPCLSTEGLSWTPALSRYPWDIDESPTEDPNRDMFFCPACAKAWIDYWEEMWREYYSGLL